MKPEVISSSLSELMQSLCLQENSSVNWEQFLHTIMEHAGACGGLLHIIDKTKKINTIEAKQKVYVAFTNIECPLDASGNKLVLTFSDKQHKHQGENFWQQINEQVCQIFQLGWQWQEKLNLQKVVKSCSQQMNVSLLNMNAKGALDVENEVPKALLDAGVFGIVGGRLQFCQDPSWLTRTQKSMITATEDYQTAYKTLQHGESALQCLLIYRREVCSGWQRKAHQFTLMLCNSSTQPSSHWLKSRFAISEAEASVASWFSIGLSAEDVAEKTGYTTHTVYSYIKKLYATLGINKQSQLTAAVWPELPI